MKQSIRSRASKPLHAPRRPHNAKVDQDFDDIHQLTRRLGSEIKRVTLNGKPVEMTWAERSLRLLVDRALAGNRRDIAQLLRIMIDHPNVTGKGPTVTRIFIRGAATKL